MLYVCVVRGCCTMSTSGLVNTLLRTSMALLPTRQWNWTRWCVVGSWRGGVSGEVEESGLVGKLVVMVLGIRVMVV